MEDSQSAPLGLRVSPKDIASVRSRDEAKELTAWNNIRRASARYIRRWGAPALESYIDDIIDEAIVENIDALLSFDVTPNEAIVRLARSLNRHRARLRRETERYTTTEALRDVVDDQHSDEVIYTEYIGEVFQVVGRALEAGLRALSNRDYSLIVSEYDLPEVATRAVDRSIGTLKSGALRTALYRARHRLLKAVEAFLSEAATEESQQSRDVLDTALKVLRAGDLRYLHYLTSDKRPRRQAKSTAYPQAAPTVSPPAFSIIWDPEVVTEGEYLELASALGDLVRSEGGLGIQIIDSNGLGVEVLTEVLV